MNGKRDQAKKRYRPGIDGLRAISVLAVIAYHLDLKWAQDGLLGVGVFFVLSGYLITDQLLMEWKWNKNILVWSFWMRRFRRLLPAMLWQLASVGYKSDMKASEQIPPTKLLEEKYVGRAAVLGVTNSDELKAYVHQVLEADESEPAETQAEIEISSNP